MNTIFQELKLFSSLAMKCLSGTPLAVRCVGAITSIHRMLLPNVLHDVIAWEKTRFESVAK